MTIREKIERMEQETLSPYATLSIHTKGREREEEPCDIRPVFQRDRDRILHSKAFRRLKNKTQVFLTPKGDHYRTRLSHTLEVSQNARTIAKALRLNEDLVEAIALGHDLGHTPFGHAGEYVLDSLCEDGFRHNEQSVRIVEKLEKNVAAIHEGGNVHQHLDLIAGLPFEDYASFGNSFNRVYRMRPEQLQLGFLKVLKGSEMRERAQEYGIRCLEEPPYEVLCTKWLSYEDMLRLKQIEEMVELYYNSGQFTHTMPFLERAFGNPFAMYETLAEFYARNGYLAAGPARVHRYRILLAFASEYDGARLAVYRELLTYDMYLRENMKSRPEFAADLSLYKDIVRSFYKREEQERALLPDYRPYDWKQMAKMTHMEPFSYPVWDVERMLEKYEDCALGASAQKQENSAFEASAGKHEDSAFGACAEKQGDSAFGASAQKQGNSAFEAPAGKQRDSASGACAEKQEDSALKSSAEKQGGSSYKSGAVRQFVLFDYQKRNPLNNEAAVQCIALPVI